MMFHVKRVISMRQSFWCRVALTLCVLVASQTIEMTNSSKRASGRAAVEGRDPGHDRDMALVSLPPTPPTVAPW